MAIRVLLVAENTSTRWGGEAILPYHYLRVLLKRGIDVQLIVHERCREELESLFPEQQDRLHFIADRPLQKLFHWCSRWLPHRVAEATVGLANQMLTQAAQRGLLRTLTDANTIVHQPIPVAPRFPSMIYDVGAPVIIGPMNGGMEYPSAFRGRESLPGRAVIDLGRAVSDLVQRLIPGKRRAQALLVANDRTRLALTDASDARVILLPENGVDLAQWGVPAVHQAIEPHSAAARFVFMGRLVDWKALDIALEAICQVDNVELDVIGDGPMRAAWCALAQTLGLGERVRFLGWLPQSDCAQILQESRGLLLPSLYECGGAVVLEAMACAQPVIATAWGGPLDYLDASCGFLVSPSSREAMIDGFRDAMQLLVEQPALGERMGAAGRARVEEHFNWESKVDTMLKVYESALASSTARAEERVTATA
ncbi:Glycosyl transferases group 1 [Bryocella elongata]|uniref:Glycosyl transferases group 1 n=1 Tax=Bryocella elongata TaxID=863522 RepID=A0A1H6AWY0_9BACT|nr:Glycosyl transferases group 1 [Bryocella elongata]